MTQAGNSVGHAKIETSNAAIMSKLLEIEAMITPLIPLAPHIPTLLALLDNPAAKFRMRRATRG